jgi:hypothetical protein
MKESTSSGTLRPSATDFLRRMAMRVSRSGGWMSVISPHSNRLRRRSSSVAICLGGRSERVEGVEELLLGALLALQELDVVDQQDVVVPVAALEGAGAVVADGVDELVGELLAGHVPDARLGVEVAGVVPDGVQQVGLAQPGSPVDEERVVGLGRGLGHGHRGRVGEPVGRPDHEPFEGVLGSQLGTVGGRPRCGGGSHLLLVADVLQGPDGDADVQRAARDPGQGGGHRRGVALLDPFLDEVVRHGQDQRFSGDRDRPGLGQPGLVGRPGTVERLEARGPDRRRVVMEPFDHSRLIPFRHLGSPGCPQCAPHVRHTLCDRGTRRNLHIHTPIHRCGEPDPCGRGGPTGPVPGETADPRRRGQMAVTGKPGQTCGAAD